MANKSISSLNRVYPIDVQLTDWLVCLHGNGNTLETSRISFGDFYNSFSVTGNVSFSNTHIDGVLSTTSYGDCTEWNEAYSAINLISDNSSLRLMAGTTGGFRGALIDNSFNSGVSVTWHEDVGKLQFSIVPGTALVGNLATANNWINSAGTNSGISLNTNNALAICPTGHGRTHYGTGTIVGGYTHITGNALSVWGDTYIGGGLTITQLGSGNVLTIEDSANPDTTPFIIDNSGNVVIGKNTTALAKLDVSGAIAGTALTLTQTTGTAPLTVSSTTVVTNLNADLLDGKQASEFAASASPTFTGTINFPSSSVFNSTGLGIGCTPTTKLDVSGVTRSTTFTSTQTTGTAPLTVSSTTVVTNLNADLLDGHHASEYVYKDDPTFTGVPNAPTATPGSSTTQIATTYFVTDAVSTLASATTASLSSLSSSLIGGAPSNLNTLGKLASAINNDYLFFQTVNNSITGLAPTASPSFTGNIVFPSGKWTSAGRLGIGTISPISPLDVVGQANFNNQITAIAGTASSSTTTGTIVVTGGVGISGALYVGGGINGTYNGTITSGQVTTALGYTPHSGTLGVGQGGTGAITFTANAVLLGNGTGALQVVAPSTSGNVLKSNGTTWSSTTLAGTELSGTTLASSIVTSSLTTVGTIATGTWSGSFGAVSGANLTSLTAGNLTGTIPTAVLGNSTHYIGTTAVTLNRGSSALVLTGITSIDGSSASANALNTANSYQVLALGVNTAASGTGTIRTTGDITAYYSDRRLKTNITQITNALDKVDELFGCYYTQNKLAESFGYNDYSKQVGLIAQDVQRVFPESITNAPFDTDENGNSISGENYLTIKYEKIIPLLVEAIKELRQQIKNLQ